MGRKTLRFLDDLAVMLLRFGMARLVLRTGEAVEPLKAALIQAMNRRSVGHVFAKVYKARGQHGELWMFSTREGMVCPHCKGEIEPPLVERMGT